MYQNKNSIIESDLVLIHIENKPAFYGRVEEITTDVKPKWWRVKFLFLTVPYQVSTWTLDNEQIRGADFTMGGTPMRIEKVVVQEVEENDKQDLESPQEKDEPSRKARVLSLGENKNKTNE